MTYMNNKIINSILVICFTFGSLFASGCLNYQNRWTGGLGLVLAQVEDGVVIKEITPTFQSEADALLPGDMILKVDGNDVSAYPKEAIVEAITGPVGGLVSVTVLRSGDVITFEIERIMLKNASEKTLYSKKMKRTPLSKVADSSKKQASEEKDTGSAEATTVSTDDDALSDDTDNTATDTDDTHPLSEPSADTDDTAGPDNSEPTADAASSTPTES
ncbi:MAG: PDZ domain-containing protein [Deltaproteobacteria bacterium]|nr:PDZ domain-containing protein [Deltaproteobacteria bacterium]MBN2671391.1 PDZ domain-containing protein [Deltaproteobacteria bacterium]